MAVDIAFTCIPLRSLSRFDPPIDATEQQRDLVLRLHNALNKHGAHNAFYLCDGRCVFHLTNDESEGMVSFRFEGTVLTDAEDRKTVGSDLQVEFEGGSCDWLTAAAVDVVARNRTGTPFASSSTATHRAGDLQKTIDRLQQLEAETNASGGY